jgi:hypothetical protein
VSARAQRSRKGSLVAKCNIPVVSGPEHPRWKGGRTLERGYVRVLLPGHPRGAKGYVREHIVIAEKALGRHLPDTAVVHHVDNERTNNSNTNLVICQDQAYHLLLHQRARALKACGHADWLNCHYCHGYASPELLYVHVSQKLRRHTYSFHRKCHAEYEYKRRRKGTPASTPSNPFHLPSIELD